MSKADFVQRFFMSDHLTTTFMLNNKYEIKHRFKLSMNLLKYRLHVIYPNYNMR